MGQNRKYTQDMWFLSFSFLLLCQPGRNYKFMSGVRRIDLVIPAFSSLFTYLRLLDMYNSYYGQNITIISNKRCQCTGLSEVFSGAGLGARFHVVKAAKPWFQLSSRHLPSGPTELCYKATEGGGLTHTLWNKHNCTASRLGFSTQLFCLNAVYLEGTSKAYLHSNTSLFLRRRNISMSPSTASVHGVSWWGADAYINGDDLTLVAGLVVWSLYWEGRLGYGSSGSEL